MPTLKGTQVSLSYVQCFLYLVSSINVSIFHITWLDTFCPDLVCSLICSESGNAECYNTKSKTSICSTNQKIRNMVGKAKFGPYILTLLIPKADCGVPDTRALGPVVVDAIAGRRVGPCRPVVSSELFTDNQSFFKFLLPSVWIIVQDL